MKEQDRHNDDFQIPGIEQGGPTPFKVPDGYFDELTPRVMSRIHESESPAEKTPTGFPIGRLVGFGLAAVLLGVFFFNPFGNQKLDMNTEFAEVANSSTLEFLMDEEDISIDDLLAADLIDLEEESELGEDAYLDYLIENEVELTTIVEELTL